MEQDIDCCRGLALARLRGKMAEPAIAAGSGPAITTRVVAKQINCSCETIRNRINRGEFIGYRTEISGTRWLLPLWQFDSRLKVHSWVAPLVEAYGANGVALLNFVTAPRLSLNGVNYLQLLQSGRGDEVLAAAGRSNPD